ncbi:TerD family protein [Streptomyces sp. NPDC058001]|uniref:TerD family protein n=1 Tax=Streptomyces sp. NPDC058001 TaxID=3346300 RepID=UPI0036ECA948
MTHITKGANTPVPAAPVRVAVCRAQAPGIPTVDASALLLDARGKVRGDADLVFYNQPHHPSGAVRHAGTAEGGGQAAEWLELDLHAVEPDVQRVVIAASCDGGVFGAVPGLYVQTVGPDGLPVAQYTVTDASTETAFVLGEFYRRDGAWKFRAVGQGYDSGLAGLATDFGISVEEEQGPEDAVPVQAPRQGVPQDAVPGAAAPFVYGSEFQPFARRGHGNDVITVDAPVPPGPVIVEAWHQGEGYFAVQTLDHRNKNDELLFNTTVDDFRGRTLTPYPSDRHLRLRVEADNDWTVVVQPVSVVRHLGTAIQGQGPEVLAYTGTAADLDARFDGDEDGGGGFAIWSMETAVARDLDDRELLVNEVGPLTQTAPIPDGPLLLLVEADGPWSLAARPLPVFDQGAAQESGVYQGRGHATVTLVNPNPGRPALLDYELTGDGVLFGYTVAVLDEYDDEDTLLRGQNNGERGRTLLFREGESEQRLRITDARNWKLRLLPLDQAPALSGPLEGTGSAVFRYDGPPALLDLRRLTSDDDPLTAHTAQPEGRKAISVDTTSRRPVTGPLWVPDTGHCHVLITTGDRTGWRVEPRPLSEAQVLDVSVSGAGYGVVRHTGPETEVMLTHQGRGTLDLIVLWELDERLEPIRRISLGPGLHRVPSGYLQVRTSGRWTIEARK